MHVNTSHFLLLEAEGGDFIRGTLGYVSDQNDFPTPAEINGGVTFNACNYK